MYLAQSTNWGHFPDRIGIWKCWFLRRGENRSTQRKTSWSKDENQQQTQPTYDAESGNRTRATLLGGKYSTTAPSLPPIKQSVFNYINISVDQ